MLLPRSTPSPGRLGSFAAAVLLHAVLLGLIVSLGGRHALPPPAEPPPDGTTDWTRVRWPEQPPAPASGGSSAAPRIRDPRVIPPPASPEPRPPTVIAPLAPTAAADPAPPEAPDTPGTGEADGTTGEDGDGSDAGPGGGPGVLGGVGDGPGGPGASGPGAPAAEPMVLRSDMNPPVLVARTDPDYPALARRARVGGTVILRCVIGVDGRARVNEVARSIPLLDAAAIAAVENWRYEPARWQGRPQAVFQTIRIEFNVR